MGNIVGCCAMSISWCFCSALGSLFTSCCGNDKDSSIPPSVTSGRKRSIFLLLLSVGFAFLYQYVVGPNVTKYNNDNGPLGYIGRAWYDGCDQYVSMNDDGTNNFESQKECSGQTGVYRSAAAAFVFFILAAFAAFCKPSANREAWVAKYVLFLFLVIGTVFIPNEPVFQPIFMNIFRVGAILFMIFNQLIILDICFNVNENWVMKAERAEIEGESGKKWLVALVVLSATLYICCFVAIGLMYAFFAGCADNLAFITITLIMGIVCTLIQLTGEESSLFTSASIFSYTTYLLYTAVSKNPNGVCNPQLGKEDILGVCLGVGLTLIGVLWTGYSSTAYKTVGDDSDELHAQNENNDSEDVGGVVVSDSAAAANDGYGTMEEKEEEAYPVTFSTSWKMNVILAALCCWYSMALTSWGSILSNGSVANPQSGNFSMWMVICSQWLICLLYLWTLIAPKVFPDRDFS